MIDLPLEIIHQIAQNVAQSDPNDVISLMRTCSYIHGALVDSREHYIGLSVHLFPLQNPHLEAWPDSLTAAKSRVEQAIRKNKAFRRTTESPDIPPSLSGKPDIIQHTDTLLPTGVYIQQLFKDVDAAPLNSWATNGLRLRWCNTVGERQEQKHVVYSLDLVTGSVKVENTILGNSLLRLPHMLQKTEYFHMNPDRDFLASSRQAPILMFDIADQRLSYQLTGRDGTPLALRRVGRGHITDLNLPRTLRDVDNLRVAQLCDRFSLVRVWRYGLGLLILCDYDSMTCRTIKGGPQGEVKGVAVVKGLLWLTVEDENAPVGGETTIQEWYVDTKDATAMHIRNVCVDSPQRDSFSHATSDVISGRYIKTRKRILDTDDLSVMEVKPVSVFGVVMGQVHCWSYTKDFLQRYEKSIRELGGDGRVSGAAVVI